MTTEATPSNGSILDKLESQYLRSDLPQFRVGDTVSVYYRIVEGDKTRVQVFKGLVLKRHRAGARSTFTVRKTSFGVGVERTFVLNSPRVEKIEVVARGVVRRARLFYLRELTGKKARVRGRADMRGADTKGADTSGSADAEADAPDEESAPVDESAQADEN
jgi:large subunit ribosomal protein L19